MIILSSTRFNTQTWDENCRFREKNKLNGCIYCSPQSMPAKIDIGATVFVVEMNNSTNEIEGIGLIKNRPITNKSGIYEERHFNRYVFVGEYRINRDVLLRYNSQLVHSLDHILFKEKTHLKRGCGMTTIPEKLLKHDICQQMNIKMEIRNLFILQFSEKIN